MLTFSLCVQTSHFLCFFNNFSLRKIYESPKIPCYFLAFFKNTYILSKYLASMQVIANNDKTMHQALSYLTHASHGIGGSCSITPFFKKITP